MLKYAGFALTLRNYFQMLFEFSCTARSTKDQKNFTFDSAKFNNFDVNADVI
jgi:hypothetical protein